MITVNKEEMNEEEFKELQEEINKNPDKKLKKIDEKDDSFVVLNRLLG